MKFKEIKNNIDRARTAWKFEHIRHVMYNSAINGDITIEEYRALLDLLYAEESVAKGRRTL